MANLATKLFVSVALWHITFLACADSYQVTNYKGSVGKYLVHLSIQQYDGFGSGINVMGSYYYDKHMKVIPLYGKLELDKLVLCEIHGSSEYERIIVQGSVKSDQFASCPLNIRTTENGAFGSYSSPVASYEVHLSRESSMKNSTISSLNGTLEIPYWTHSKYFMIVGNYFKSGKRIGVTVSVLDQRTRAEIGRFAPQCDFGLYMTPIYMNIENFTPGMGETINVNCAGGHDGTVVEYMIGRDGKVSPLQ